MRNNWYGAFLFLGYVIFLVFMGSITYWSLCFLLAKEIPWFLFVWVFLGYLSAFSGGSIKISR